MAKGTHSAVVAPASRARAKRSTEDVIEYYRSKEVEIEKDPYRTQIAKAGHKHDDILCQCTPNSFTGTW